MIAGFVRVSSSFAYLVCALAVMALPFLAEAEESASPDDQLETPAQIWQRCQETLLPLNFEIQKDEIVQSVTHPCPKNTSSTGRCGRPTASRADR